MKPPAANSVKLAGKEAPALEVGDLQNPPGNASIHPKYRADIDGLRAIAVLAVVGFHAFPDWLTGGFVGVDVFFVISGYLISLIIFGGLDTGRLDFARFYSRRIKRIFPALALVLIFCYTFGWFTLLADEYKQLGKHIASGAGFVSNFALWDEAGYFDNAAETKPLLHLWSLGIEEQFYIVWPFLLWVAWKRRFNRFLVILSIATISFALNVRNVNNDEVGAFYSPVSRFWELLTGSTLAYITLYKNSSLIKLEHYINVLSGSLWSAPRPLINRGLPAQTRAGLRDAKSIVGFILIVIAVLAISKEKAFPGFWALLPTIGAFLIISAGPGAWVNRNVLMSRILVWFGLISYPLYLWHWPLLSFARIIDLAQPTPVTRIACVLISVALAWLTYRLVERPVRFSKASATCTATLCVLTLAIGFAGYYSFKSNGLNFRQIKIKSLPNALHNSEPMADSGASRPKAHSAVLEVKDNNTIALRKYLILGRNDPEYISKLKDERQAGLRSPYCHFNDPGQTFDEYKKGIDECLKIDGNKKNILIIGDSHAADIYVALSSAYSDINFLQATGARCAPISSLYKGKASQCGELLEYAIEYSSKNRLDGVILAARWRNEFESVIYDINRIRANGNVVALMGPNVQYSAEVKDIIGRRPDDKTLYKWMNRFMEPERKTLSDKMKEFSRINGIAFIDRISIFCENGCPVFNSDGELLIFDYGHLSKFGAIYFGRQLFQNRALDTILASRQH